MKNLIVLTGLILNINVLFAQNSNKELSFFKINNRTIYLQVRYTIVDPKDKKEGIMEFYTECPLELKSKEELLEMNNALIQKLGLKEKIIKIENIFELDDYEKAIKEISPRQYAAFEIIYSKEGVYLDALSQLNYGYDDNKNLNWILKDDGSIERIEISRSDKELIPLDKFNVSFFE